MVEKVPVTIILSARLVAAMSAIAKIKGLRETSTEGATRVFQAECRKIYEELKDSPNNKFSEEMAMMIIADNIVEDAEEQIFEAVLLALDGQEDLSYSPVIDNDSGDKSP